MSSIFVFPESQFDDIVTLNQLLKKTFIQNFMFFDYRSGNTSVHVQNLLLLLPSIRQADTMVRWFWLKVRQDGKIPLKKLMIEMLDAASRDKTYLEQLKIEK